MNVFIQHHTQAQDPLATLRHGVQILALAPTAEVIDGVRTMSAEEARDTLVAALDLLMEKSPWTAVQIARLKKSGNVYLVYNADVPADTRNQLTLAIYVSDFYTPSEGKTDFVAFVGRTGIQWPLEHIAAAIAHELAGHGVQDLRGRLEGITTGDLDTECEAFLYHERAIQDLGMDKTLTEIVQLRQAIEFYWCDDFRRYLIAEDPPAAAEWDKLNPDIPTLLDAFETYRAQR